MWPFGGRFFPGTNLQDLNLDWIIQKVKDLAETVAGVDERIDGAYEAAAEAQESASAAETSAQQAQTSASTAETAAQSAQTTAQQARTAAQTAQSTAQSAQSAAQTAQQDITTINTYLSDHIPTVAVTDLNDLTPNGIIRLLRWRTDTLNTPASEGLVSTGAGGMCMSFSTTANAGVQLAISTAARKIFMRTYYTGTWSAWELVAPVTAASTTGFSGALTMDSTDPVAETGVAPETPAESM